MMANMAGSVVRLLEEANRLGDEIKRKKDRISQLDSTIPKKQTELDALRLERADAEKKMKDREAKLQSMFTGFSGLEDAAGDYTMTTTSPTTAPRATFEDLDYDPMFTTPPRRAKRLFEHTETETSKLGHDQPSSRRIDPGNGKDTGPERINDQYPTVVKIDGVWFEIRCKHCGANATHHGSHFLNGCMGMNVHIKKAHVPEQESGLHLDHCIMRAVSDRDIKLMGSMPPLPPRDVPINICQGKKYCSGCDMHKRKGRVGVRKAKRDQLESLETSAEPESKFDGTVSSKRSTSTFQSALQESAASTYTPDSSPEIPLAAKPREPLIANTHIPASPKPNKQPLKEMSSHGFKSFSPPRGPLNQHRLLFDSGLIDLSGDIDDDTSDDDTKSFYQDNDDSITASQNGLNQLWPPIKRVKREDIHGE